MASKKLMTFMQAREVLRQNGYCPRLDEVVSRASAVINEIDNPNYVWTDAQKELARYLEGDAMADYKCPECKSTDPSFHFQVAGSRECSHGPTVNQSEARWQKAIYELCKAVAIKCGYEDYEIDGGGCDSGDALDVTLTELGQAFSLIRESERKKRDEVVKAGRAYLEVSEIDSCGVRAKQDFVRILAELEKGE